MRSSIKVDFKHPENQQGFEPVIRVSLKQDESADPRDKLLKSFFQSLGHESSWLRIEFLSQKEGVTEIEITPVKASELSSEAEIMKTRV